MSQQPVGEFRCTNKAIYKITDEGRRLARWDHSEHRDSPNSSTTAVSTAARSSDDVSITAEGAAGGKVSIDTKLHRRISMTEKNLQDGERRARRENNTERLKHIIDEPRLQSLFREYLRQNYCEENLSFYLEVQEFKRKFNITSSAVAAPSNGRGKLTPGQAAMERHHETLVQTAVQIYNTYLAPSSTGELNIDHGLRSELSGYVSDLITGMTGKAFQGRVEMEQAAGFNATQLQAMIRLYERIQTHVFRLMATDSVPKVRAVILLKYMRLIARYSSSKLNDSWH